MLIYQAKNLVNNKDYIGQTIRTLDKRKKEHLYAAKNGCKNYFHRAIRNYGKENFEWIILEDNIFRVNKLNWLEEFYISYFETLSTQNGYNLDTGGNNHIASKETRKKMSDARKGKPGLRKGQKNSKEHNKNLSNATKGKTYTIEYCKNMSKVKKGDNYNAKTCIIMGITYKTIREAMKKLNKPRYFINKKLKDKNNKDYEY